jgi:hypothetical protein
LNGAQDQKHCEDGNEIGQSESSLRLASATTLFYCEHRSLRSIVAACQPPYVLVSRRSVISLDYLKAWKMPLWRTDYACGRAEIAGRGHHISRSADA